MDVELYDTAVQTDYLTVHKVQQLELNLRHH